MGADYRKQLKQAIVMNTGNALIAPNTTTYFGLGDEGIEGRNEIVIPFACFIDHLYVRSPIVAGVGETYTFTIRLNAAPTLLTAQVAGAIQFDAQDLINGFAVAAGDRICCQFVSSLNAANTAALASVRLRPT